MIPGNRNPATLLLPLAVIVLALFFFRAFFSGASEESIPVSDPILESRISAPVAPDQSEEAAPGPARIGNKAPAFVVDGPGDPVRLSDYRGKPLAVEFIATWCPHCRASAPAFAEVFSSSDVSLLVLGAAREPLAKVQAWHRDFLPRPMPGQVAVDPDQMAVRAYGVTGTPTTAFIDRDGVLRRISVGELSESELRQYLSEIS